MILEDEADLEEGEEEDEAVTVVVDEAASEVAGVCLLILFRPY